MRKQHALVKTMFTHLSIHHQTSDILYDFGLKLNQDLILEKRLRVRDF